MPTPPRRPTPPSRSLERVLLRHGAASRAEARALVLARRVRVDGRVVADPSAAVRDGARIEIDGADARPIERVAIALHKPAGCVTTARDPEGRPTVFDHLADAPRGLRAVGRLDLDTSGLLVLTNDTRLADRIADPRSRIPKTYELRTRSKLSDAQLARLCDGVELADGPARALSVERCAGPERGRWIALAIDEGRNREVRRMIHAVGGEVRELVRVA
ncbi:MAG: rRNA pseudouridine synthase, partial [Planctomycetota bacterium]